MNSVRHSFTPVQHLELIERSLTEIDGELPDGYHLRLSEPLRDFVSDLSALDALPMAADDLMDPCYGMAPGDSSGEITIIIENDAVPVGQLSADLTAASQRSSFELEIHISGIFLSNDCRGQNLSKSMCDAVLLISRLWIEDLKSEFDINEVDVTVSADTEASSAGSRVIAGLDERASHLYDRDTLEFST